MYLLDEESEGGIIATDAGEVDGEVRRKRAELEAIEHDVKQQLDMLEQVRSRVHMFIYSSESAQLIMYVHELGMY